MATEAKKTTEAAKHTPGPWMTAGFPSEREHDRVNINAHGPHGLHTVAQVMRNSRSVQTDCANARLIAAAPELLEACRDTIEALRNLRLKECYGNDFGGTYKQDVDCPCTCCKIRAAIAKAVQP